MKTAKPKKVSISTVEVELGASPETRKLHVPTLGSAGPLKSILPVSRALSTTRQLTPRPVSKCSSRESAMSVLTEEESLAGGITPRTKSAAQSLVSWDMEDHIGVRLIRSGIAGITDLGLSRENSSLSELSFDKDEASVRLEERIKLRHLHQLMHQFLTHQPYIDPRELTDRLRLHRLKNRQPQGCMNLEEFKQTLTRVLKTNDYDEYLDKLFTKLDTSCDGYVDWNEFCTYMLLLYRENDYLRTKREIPFMTEPKIRHIVHNRQESTSRIVTVENPYRFVSVSKEGAVSIWNSHLRFDKVFMVTEEEDDGRSSKRRFKMWVTDVVYMPNCRKLAIASTSRDIRFYDVTSNQFYEEFHLFAMPDVPYCFNYWYDKKVQGGGWYSDLATLVVSPPRDEIQPTVEVAPQPLQPKDIVKGQQFGPPPAPLPYVLAIQPAPLDEDPREMPLDMPSEPEDIAEVYRQHWSTIRQRFHRNCSVQDQYNFRLRDGSRSTLDACVRAIYDDQTAAFKVNFAYGLILRHRETNQVRYYYPSMNNARVLTLPHLVQNQASLGILLQDNHEYANHDPMTWGQHQRPDTKWYVEHVTNVVFYVNKLPDIMIGAPATPLPDYLLQNQGLYCLVSGSHGPYMDNLCLFRCLAIHLDKTLHKDCDTSAKRHFDTFLAAEGREAKHFQGVPLAQLDNVEKIFNINIEVYQLTLDAEQRPHAVCLRRSLGLYTTSTMTLNLHEHHFSYVFDKARYAHQYQCRQCCRHFDQSYHLHRHEKICEVSVKKVYPGGVYHTAPTNFDELIEAGVPIPSEDLYFPYRACFDFEAYLKPLDTSAPNTTSKTIWIDRHIPMSVSVNSNVPGYQHPRCFVSDGDPYNLIATFIEYLNSISATSYRLLLEKFDWVIQALDAQIPEQGPGQPKPKPPPYAGVLKEKILKYLVQLPVLGFNTGRYDFNMVKRYMYPYLAHQHTLKYVIKKQQSHMAISTDTLLFLDVYNYLAPNFSYDKWIKAYDCKLTKGTFCYTYVDNLARLDETTLPPRTAFNNTLKNTELSEDEYAALQDVWTREGMTTLKDFLVWYNNLDVEPFMEAAEKMASFYQGLCVDVFKQCFGIPGLTLRYVFQGLTDYFSLVEKRDADMYTCLKQNIVGGPSIIFTRHHQAGITKIRGGKTCQQIVGFDANALYLSCLASEMPAGHYARWLPSETEAVFTLRRSRTHIADQWLDWEAHVRGITIRHQTNHTEKRVGDRRLPVDGFAEINGHQTVFQAPSNESLLIFGTDTGDIHLFYFNRPTAQLFDAPSKRDGIVRRIFYQDLPHHGNWLRHVVCEKVHLEVICKVLYLPENEAIISSSADPRNSLVIADIQGLKKNYIFKLEKGVENFDHKKSLNLLVTGSSDHLVRLWNPYVTSKPIAVLTGHATGVIDVVIHEDLNQVFTYSKDAVLKVWDIKEQTCVQTVVLKFPSSIHGRMPEHGQFSLHLESRLPLSCILITCNDYVAQLKLGSRPAPLSYLPQTHDAQLCSAVFNPLFKQVVTGCDSSTVAVWELETGNKSIVFSNAHGDEEITCMAFDESYRKLLTGARNGTIKVWNFQNGHNLHKLEPVSETEVTGILTLQEKKAILAVGWSRLLTLYDDSDPDNMYVKATDYWKGEQLHQDDILSVDVCPPHLLVTASFDGAVIVWYLDTEKTMIRLRKGRPNNINNRVEVETTSRPESCSSRPQSQNSRPNSRHRTSHKVEKGQQAPVDKVMFLRARLSVRYTDSAVLVSSEGGVIRFWSLYSNRHELGYFYAPDSPDESVLAVCTKPNNSILITGDTQGLVKIWNIMSYCTKPENRRVKIKPPLEASWHAHESAIVSVEYIEDGDSVFVLSASTDCTARLWTLTGEYVGTFGQKRAWNLKDRSTWGHPHTPWTIQTDGKTAENSEPIIDVPDSSNIETGSRSNTNIDLEIPTLERGDTLTSPLPSSRSLITTSGSLEFKVYPPAIFIHSAPSHAHPCLPELLANTHRSQTFAFGTGLQDCRKSLLGVKAERDFERKKRYRQSRRGLFGAIDMGQTARFGQLCSPYQALSTPSLAAVSLPNNLPVSQRMLNRGYTSDNLNEHTLKVMDLSFFPETPPTEEGVKTGRKTITPRIPGEEKSRRKLPSIRSAQIRRSTHLLSDFSSLRKQATFI